MLLDKVWKAALGMWGCNPVNKGRVGWVGVGFAVDFAKMKKKN